MGGWLGDWRYSRRRSLCLRRRGIVRIQVAVLNLDAFKSSTIDSLSSDVVVQRKGYEFRYTLEESDFHVDSDFVPRVWEHGDDPWGDKGHDREDSVRNNDPSKRSKPTSSSNNSSDPTSLGGVVPMQMASVITSTSPHRGLPAMAAPSPLRGPSSSGSDTSSRAASPTTAAQRPSTPPPSTCWSPPPNPHVGSCGRPVPEGTAPSPSSSLVLLRLDVVSSSLCPFELARSLPWRSYARYHLLLRHRGRRRLPDLRRLRSSPPIFFFIAAAVYYANRSR